MKGHKHMKTVTNIIYPALAVFAFTCLAVLPRAQAVSPAPDGCYPGFTTAEGCNALQLLTTGAGNTGVGWGSLESDTTGSFNTAVGAGALILNNGDSNTAVGAVALLLNTTGTQNTAIGTDAMVYNNTGSNNTANGAFALFSNTTGDDNTAIGQNALQANTTGLFNTATGALALTANTTGSQNTAFGRAALFTNTTGFQNTALGIYCLEFNTTGNNNVAIGNSALQANTTGTGNVATGQGALLNNTTADNNTAYGTFALSDNTTGFFNMASGANALQNNTVGIGNTGAGNAALLANTTGLQNTACGNAALFETTTGFLNTALGMAAGDFTAGDNNILIGNLGVAMESNTIRIGMEVAANDEFGIPHPAHTATYIAGISGQTAADGVAVYVNTDGKLGTLTSSARFKTEIKPMDESSTAILALKPVTFRYKQEIDPKGIPQFGLVAEEVEKVKPDLVSRDSNGKPYTVRYEAVNAMLLNEFLKAHRKIEEQEHTIAQLKSGVDALIATVKEQGSQIQKVSAQLELTKLAPQTVANR